LSYSGEWGDEIAARLRRRSTITSLDTAVKKSELPGLGGQGERGVRGKEKLKHHTSSTHKKRSKRKASKKKRKKVVYVFAINFQSATLDTT